MSIEDALKVARDYLAIAIETPPVAAILTWEDIVNNITDKIKEAAKT
jgi:hypothetical protein